MSTNDHLIEKPDSLWIRPSVVVHPLETGNHRVAIEVI